MTEPIEVIANILQTELELRDGQVMFTNEKFNIPTSPGLYIAIAYVTSKTIAASSSIESPSGADREKYPDAVAMEIQRAAMFHIIQIDAMSFDDAARSRKDEIPLALASVFSVQTQDGETVKIARLPSAMIDVSSLELTKRLNRYTTTISVHALAVKRKPVSFYENFKIELKEENINV